MLAAALSGCASPYRTDQGALFGGVTGAGLGAIVGGAVGHPLAGAAIGAGTGAVTGAVVGGQLDQIEARNRAEIEARLGRPIAPGSVTFEDVVAMTKAGISEEIIINHIRIHGSARVPQTNDLIFLQQSGVTPRVIEALQQPARATTVPAAPVVIQEEPYWADPWHPYGPAWYPAPPPWHRRPWNGPRPAPGVSIGVGF